MTFRSNRNPMFRSQFSESIFNQKYAHQGAETWDELCQTLVNEVCGEYLVRDEIRQLIDYMSRMLFIPGGRYLYYAGRPNPFYNNCYLLKSQEDTREDWANLSWKAESCLMTGGGIGNDYSIYRPEGATISRTGGTASGPIPKMEMINEIGRRVMQGGSRRSAIYASLNWKHQDVSKFLEIKNWDKIKVPGTDTNLKELKQKDFNWHAPLDMTNISVNYDTEWLLNYWENGNVGDVFLKNVEQALSTAEPGFSFNFFGREHETARNACVRGDTQLLTMQGYYPIKELVGREVKIWNGQQWSKVTPFSTGHKALYRVHLSDGSSLDVSDNHKFLVIENFNNTDASRVATKDLSEGMKLQKWLMPIQDGCEQDPAIDPYSQGFYSGDGNADYPYSYLYDTKYSCEVRLAGECLPDASNRKRWKHGWMLSKAFVPINNSFYYKINWLAGLLDSDGTVTRDTNGNGLQIASVDKSFLQRVRLMLSTMGCRTKIVGGSDAGFKSMPDGKGGYKSYWCQKSYRLLIGNADTYSLLQNGLTLNRLEAHKEAPQRDARQYVKVLWVEDLETKEETFCVSEPILNQMTINGIVTGNCTEVVSADDSDVCNLGSINIARVSSITEMKSVVELAIKFLMCGTLKAKLPYQQVYNVREKNRRLGLGLMGIHEWLIQRRAKYEVSEELHRWLEIYKEVSDKTSLEFSRHLMISTPVATRAIAPTGTIGILAGTTTGIEPIFAVAFKRRYLKGGTKWHYQYVVDSAAQELIDIYGANPDDIETALDLAQDYERRIKFQADVQDYVDMSISSTINLPSWGSTNNNPDKVVDFANTLAKYAHRLRGFTCYPDGARGGQPLTSVRYSDAREKLGEEFEESIQATDICDITGKGGSCGI